MCSHRSWFSSYQSIDDDVVFMENDISCKIIGIESIKIKMFDGIVRMLTYVKNVPELKKNLISLGFLDSSGFKYTGQGGALKVSKGSLVVTKATNIENLYKMEGNTKISEATVVSMKKSASTYLWHHWLAI